MCHGAQSEPRKREVRNLCKKTSIFRSDTHVPRHIEVRATAIKEYCLQLRLGARRVSNIAGGIESQSTSPGKSKWSDLADAGWYFHNEGSRQLVHVGLNRGTSE